MPFPQRKEQVTLFFFHFIWEELPEESVVNIFITLNQLLVCLFVFLMLFFFFFQDYFYNVSFN